MYVRVPKYEAMHFSESDRSKQEWLELCFNEELISDGVGQPPSGECNNKSERGRFDFEEEEEEDFIAHRHDQSIFRWEGLAWKV